MHAPQKYINNASTNTLDIIKAMCSDCSQLSRDCSCGSNGTEPKRRYPTYSENTHHKSQQHYPQDNNQRYDPGVSSFTSVITPVIGLTPLYSGCIGSVEFRMRRKNKTVTLQWEPFTGSLASSGVAYLTVSQTICNMPPYPMSFPISLQYKGVDRTTKITIDPFATTGGIKFYLNVDGTGTDITMGDAFHIYGGCIPWIVD